MAAAPEARVDELRAAFEVLRRFHDWLRDEHEIACDLTLQEAGRALLDPVERLHAAGEALAACAPPSPSGNGQMTLARVVGAEAGAVHLEILERGEAMRIGLKGGAEHFEDGDLVMGAFERGAADSGFVLGAVTVVPAGVEHLFG